MISTADYYNSNAQRFSESTRDLNMLELYRPFEQRLKAGARILDVGCGSGRDSKYFSSKGYSIDAIEPSPELVKIATSWSGVAVKLGSVQDLTAIGKYDGIWACASLLHIREEELQSAFATLARALKAGGTIYCSFKYGEFEGTRDGRHFTDLTEAAFAKIVDGTGLTILETRISNGVRPDVANIEWLNALLTKD